MVDKDYLKLFRLSDQIYIFGAGVRGRTLKRYLSLINPQIEISGFLVSCAENNPDKIDDIPVKTVSDMVVMDRNDVVAVATKMQYHQEVEHILLQKGFHNIVLMTPELDNVIKRVYFQKRFKMENKPFGELSDKYYKRLGKKQLKNKFMMFVVKSVVDKKADVSAYEKWWISDIQAGASLTEQTIAEFKDNTGENISCKNRSYCELTAIYWIWKNITTEYVGVCHYRRRFVLTEENLSFIIEKQVDVVLPVPTGCEPSVRENYCERHKKEDWDIMMQILGEYYPEYYSVAEKIFEDNYYYACNMWIMKKEICNRFCLWLFDILNKIEQRCDCRRENDTYQHRYIGFLAERLTTLYFKYYADNLKIAYADKIFIK